MLIFESEMSQDSKMKKKILFHFLEAQQYHVYTLQPLSNPAQISSTGLNTTLTQQQQEYIHEQQELKGS